MNYEQKYKEALNWIRNIYPTMQGAEKEDAERHFPELKESKDEKIRKVLIKGFQYYDKESKWGEFTTTEILSWLEKQGEQPNKVSIWKHWNNGVAQNSAWSEEDERMLSFIDAILEYAYNNNSRGFGISCIDLKMWLKSFKDRVQSQLEQEWSEKDKHILKNIHDFVKENTIDSNRVNCAEECLNWLKSLKPQTHWKPSDGQMKAIKYFIDFHRSQANASTEGWSEFKHLESLYNILKKL